MLKFGIYKSHINGSLVVSEKFIGKGEKVIRLFKFRTEIQDGERENAKKLRNFLRSRYLDRLLVLWNVILGNVSLVGPKIVDVELDKSLSEKIEYFTLRYSIKPGLVSWAQVAMPKTKEPRSVMEYAREELAYDLYYIKYRSLWMDMRTLCKFLLGVLKKS